MSFRSFRHNFHDGWLAAFLLGPRRELTLEIALDPVWNKDAALSVSVRLGGIGNYEEVALFFNKLPKSRLPYGFIAEIIGLNYMRKGPNWVVLDLAAKGHIEIQSRNVTES